jgi:hypothetical protein
MSDTAAARPWPIETIERRPVDKLIPYARNARKHTAKQIATIAASIREFGWTMPVLIDEADLIIAGHGRVLAAPQVDLIEVPVIVARGWTAAQKRAYRVADNQIALNAAWDNGLLRVELADLHNEGFDLEMLGFATADATARDDFGGELPQALQLEPAREYAVIMCQDAAEWERLKVALSLVPVRRGGYKKGSPFDDVGTQRVVAAADILRLIAEGTADNADRRSKQRPRRPRDDSDGAAVRDAVRSRARGAGLSADGRAPGRRRSG